MSARLALAIEAGTPPMPETGRIAVFAPRDGFDLSSLPKDRCDIITGFKPDFDRFQTQGFACHTLADGPFAASVVCLPRAKALAQSLIAQAVQTTQGPVIIDGTKSDGIEATYKACRTRADVSAALSKSHGKLFYMSAKAGLAGSGFEDWRTEAAQKVEGGFVTAPGVFSADGVDPASRLLADHLPAKLGAHVADLGAGWGYLSTRILDRPDIELLHLVEADHAALTCAKTNVDDSRARFHWEDVTRWDVQTPLDCVVMNPPFHTARTPEPVIGQSFIHATSRLLHQKGQLFLVANRHLPYERSLEQSFAEVAEFGTAFGGDTRFKLLRAARPKSGGRQR